ncbi:MAG: carboxypeptidase regulatory-like domain-containing protein, partial [Chloracidobacterium sp.]|nr:carboxypeptidase regulatory-like domain-containing protein [Chloracidobacterium sp.]
MKNRISSSLMGLLLGLLVAGFPPFQQALAQSSAGGGAIQGTVRDEAGAAIAGAKVKITNEATGLAQNLVTNESGYYVTPALSIGVYAIRVEAQGMKSWEGKVQVETARSASVEVVMVVGHVGDTVTIEGSVVPLVNTAEPTEGSTLDSKRISELPINGRNINTLIEDVTPGVEGINNSNGGVRIGGMMVYSTNYLQDGASTNNIEMGGSGVIQGIDSIGEVRIETSTSSAKYTTPTSVIITTKGGGNQIHGSLFETHRNNAFGVARARQDVLFNGQDYQAPQLIRNEYGGSISGPVYLPRFGEGGKTWYDGHNRTFFFFSREGLRLRQGITRDFSVPTLAMRQGDFSQLIDSQGRLQVLYDPLTTQIETINGRQVAVRDPFPNNQIPISRISPLAKYLFSITPLPNIAANPLTGANLRTAVPTTNFPDRDDDYNTVRLDHRFGEKDNGFLKVNGGKSYYHFIGNAGGIGPPTANNEANVTYLPMATIAGALSWT